MIGAVLGSRHRAAHHGGTGVAAGTAVPAAPFSEAPAPAFTASGPRGSLPVQASGGRPLLALDGVSRRYGHGEAAVTALRDVTLTVDRGEFVAIMGPSGSGKSTLLHILGCLDVPTSGRYLFDGQDVSRLRDEQLAALRNRGIGFVFQQFHLLAELSAWRNVELPLLYRGDRQLSASERRTRSVETLRAVGLGDHLEHRPNQLSGGQQQRVAIARALVTDPDLILADEPTGNLDSAAAAEVLAILVELHRSGRTIVLITHDPTIAAAARRTVRIRDGRLTEAPAGGDGTRDRPGGRSAGQRRADLLRLLHHPQSGDALVLGDGTLHRGDPRRRQAARPRAHGAATG
jgi:putative ABC transport system ATP-binding protein